MNYSSIHLSVLIVGTHMYVPILSIIHSATQADRLAANGRCYFLSAASQLARIDAYDLSQSPAVRSLLFHAGRMWPCQDGKCTTRNINWSGFSDCDAEICHFTGADLCPHSVFLHTIIELDFYRRKFTLI